MLIEVNDACVAPVLTLAEAVRHEHNVAGKTTEQVWGITHPRPAPRFSRSQPGITRSPSVAGQHTTELLGELMVSSSASLRRSSLCGIAIETALLIVSATSRRESDF